jgi:thiol-disulfide isomerase/thioredoxin
LQANPDDQKALTMFLTKVQRQLGPIARSEPDKAEAELKSAQDLLAKLRAEAKDEAIQKLYVQADQLFARLQRSIDSAKRLAALIGQPAAPLNVETWVNGTPLSDADLKGKVVLLDFWAVWCGPCIATFPHLREWQEKYADKGLVIVGLTKYYGFAWDQEKGQPTRPASQSRPPQQPGATEATAPPPAPPAQPTPAEEQEMLQKFAEKYELHHRFAIQKDDALSAYYAVTGIPHVVVIDRDGKVRLIRVGSGDENARDVEAMITSLLGDGTNKT